MESVQALQKEAKMSLYICPFCGTVVRCDFGDCDKCDFNDDSCLELLKILQDDEVEICSECHAKRRKGMPC